MAHYNEGYEPWTFFSSSSIPVTTTKESMNFLAGYVDLEEDKPVFFREIRRKPAETAINYAISRKFHANT